MSRSPSKRRGGLTLIEVLVALAIVALTAAAFATLAGQGVHNVALAHANARQIAEASAELATVSTWPRHRLLDRAGRSRLGGFILIVNPTMSGLFEIAIADTVHGTTLLSTALYSSEPNASP